MLEFETYKKIMAMVAAYVQNLTNAQNDKFLEERIALLKDIEGEGHKTKYDQHISDLALYQARLQEALMRLTQELLEIMDDQVIINSNEAYHTRAELFEFMKEYQDKKGDKYQKKLSVKRLDSLTQQNQEDAYNFYTDKLNAIQQMMASDPTAIERSDNSVNFLEEQIVRLEDQVYVKYNVRYTELRMIVQKRQLNSSTNPAAS